MNEDKKNKKWYCGLITGQDEALRAEIKMVCQDEHFSHSNNYLDIH